MKKLNFILILFTVCLSVSAFAGKPEKGNRTHPSTPPPMSDQDFKMTYLDAQDLFNYEYYDEALTLFLQLLAVDFNNSNINFYVGVCILNGKKDRAKSISYLEKASKKTDASYSYSYKETAAPVFTFLYLGQAYQLSGKYDEAIKNYEKFQTFLTNKNKDGAFIDEVEHCIRMAKLAKKLVTKPVKVKIEPVKQVNSTFSDLALIPSLDGNTYYFTSKRKGSTGNERDNFGEYMDDIYFTQFKDNKWQKPKKMASKINSSASDVLNCISPDGKELYFSRQVRGTYDIFVSGQNKKGKWLPPKSLGININTKYNEQWAFITSDGNTLLCSSDKPGGYGGYDIYMSEKTATGDWGKPFNLGPDVNTPYDEICPVLMPDGTLYFSSNGHETMGGFDIFTTTISEDGLWSPPENLGYPINTPADDLNFYPTTPDGKKGFYTTAKSLGYGASGIFSFSIE
jgi:tetratricopeptide (TPR) repeat protein